MIQRLVLSAMVLAAGAARAEMPEFDYLKISSRTVQLMELQDGERDRFVSTMQPPPIAGGTQLPPLGGPGPLPGLNSQGQTDLARTAGDVIRTGRDLVAFGEEAYRLVDRGHPVITSNYAPISVLPRSGNEMVDISETENWSLPKTQRVRVAYKNGFGAEVVVFEYAVIFSYGGSYNGAGKYLAAAQIIPVHSRASWGHTLDSAMTLNGITNMGSRAEPVATAILNVRYRVSTLTKAEEFNDTFHITGRGEIVKL